MDLEDGLRRAFQAKEQAARRGLTLAGMRALNDAVMQVPRVPLKEGTLRGSGSVFVDGKLVQTSAGMGPDGTPATEIEPSLAPDAIEVVVGFNTPYAAYQHEGVREDGSHVIRNHSEPGSGTKFLETPLQQNRDAYMAIVADTMRKVTG